MEHVLYWWEGLLNSPGIDGIFEREELPIRITRRHDEELEGAF